MPLYDLVCLVKPRLRRVELVKMLKTVGTTVFQQHGVLTDLRSFGLRPLAYEFRKQGVKYEESEMWQMSFVLSPDGLKEVDHRMRIDENVLRYLFLRKRALAPMPTSHTVAKLVRKEKEKYLEDNPEDFKTILRWYQQKQGVLEPAVQQPAKESAASIQRAGT